jgi:hypothetical protein
MAFIFSFALFINKSAAQANAYITESVTLDAVTLSKYTTEYEDIVAFKFDHHFINAILKDEKGIAFGLKVGQQEVNFNLHEHEIRSANFSLRYADEGGNRIMEQGDSDCNTYWGKSNGNLTDNVAAFINYNSFKITWFTTAGTYIIFNTSEENAEEKTYIWAKTKPSKGISCDFKPEQRPESSAESRNFIPCANNPIAAADKLFIRTLFLETAFVVVYYKGLEDPLEQARVRDAISLNFTTVALIYDTEIGLNLLLDQIFLATNPNVAYDPCMAPDFVFVQTGLNGSANTAMCSPKTSFAEGGASIRVISHELGHILGAFQHDCICDGIMMTGACPNTNVIPTNSFSTTSKTAIVNYLKGKHACLLDNPGTLSNSDYISGSSFLCLGDEGTYNILLPKNYTLIFPTPPITYKEKQLIGTAPQLSVTYKGTYSGVPGVNSTYYGPYKVKAISQTNPAALLIKVQDCSGSIWRINKKIRIGEPEFIPDFSITQKWIASPNPHNPIIWHYSVTAKEKFPDTENFHCSIRVKVCPTCSVISYALSPTTLNLFNRNSSTPDLCISATVSAENRCGRSGSATKWINCPQFKVTNNEGGFLDKSTSPGASPEYQNENIAVNSLNCYPNPVNNELNLSWPSGFNDGLSLIMNITDILGRQKMQKQLPINENFARIEIEGLETGTYIVTLSHNGEGKKLHQLFTKQ